MSENLNRPDPTFDRPVIARCDCCREMKLSSELLVVFGIGAVCFSCRANGNSPRRDRGV